MRHISQFASRPEEKEIIVIDGRASVFIRTHIEEVTVTDPEGEERTEYRCIEYSTQVNAAGVKVDEAFIEELIARETEKAAAFVRMKRNELLDHSDKEMIPDRLEKKTEEEAEAWKAYRQALRDLPQQEGFPFEIDWPERP